MTPRSTRVARCAVILLGLLAGPPWGRAGGAEEPASPSGPFDPGRAPFSVKVKDNINPYKVLGLFVLPGERVVLEAGAGAPAEMRVTADAGEVRLESRRKWSWKAPGTPGRAALHIGPAGGEPAMILNAFVMIPIARVKDERLNGYRIGKYPSTPLRGLAIYRPPGGFVEVTSENRAAPVSPHFTLGQFLCKQESGWPKYLALRQKLLLKLEYLLEEVNRKGIRADSFTVMSGFRTPWYNAAIKNVKYSRHMWGGAADIFIDVAPRDGVMDDLNGDGKVDRSDAAFLYDFIESLGAKSSYEKLEGGLGSYGSTPAHGPFVHVDARGFRARWGR